MPKNNILIYGKYPVLEEVLHNAVPSGDFNFKFVSTITNVLDALKTDSYQLILYDTSSSVEELSELIKEIKKDDIYVDFISIVDETDIETAIECIKLGASDFITKPIDIEKVLIRIQVAIEKHNRTLKDHIYKRAIERRIKKKSIELWTKDEVIKKQFLGIMEALNNALQAKHQYTLGHSKRVGQLSKILAEKIALTEKDVREIHIGGVFHDIGKIGVEDFILNKPDKLTTEEFEKIKMHPIIGEEILKPITEMESLIAIVKHEHEKWNGTGYPDKIKGEKIPLGARIVALCDAFDSITTNRSYRKAEKVDFAIEEISKNAGTQFDPDIAKVFTEIMPKLQIDEQE